MAEESFQPLATGGAPGARAHAGVPFDAHIALLRLFLANRAQIVARIEGLLNTQRKPPQYLQDVPLLAHHFEHCFFTLAAITSEQRGLERQLDEAHWASGFKPRQTPGQHNDLVDAAELMSRAFLMWQRTRWPGHQGRARYAETLFNVYLLRRLMLLTMRIWDHAFETAGERLAQIQDVLDELWRTAPADQPVLVRDARWLFALAQSPTTDELHGYFTVAERIATTLAEADRIEINKASVRMAGGHLRSQLRHVSTQQGVPLDEPSLVRSTRRSNALDLATLIQALVPLLHAYEQAALRGDAEQRLDLADAICQGISPDPELFLRRLDLLAPYSMIEHLFVAADGDGHAAYTPMGRRHLRLLGEYAASIRRVSTLLLEDCTRFRPVDGAYSPYGALYGFSSRILEHIALKASQPDAVTRFTLEDVFAAGDVAKLVWVGGWRKLPHVPREVIKLFEYPQKFAEAVFARIETTLRGVGDGSDGDSGAAAKNGRLFVVRVDGTELDSNDSPPPDLPVEFILSSDGQIVAERKAVACDEAKLLHSRTEGELLVSYSTPRGWTGISKDVLTSILGVGRDVRIAGVPRAAANVLKLMCRDFVVLPEERSSIP